MLGRNGRAKAPPPRPPGSNDCRLHRPDLTGPAVAGRARAGGSQPVPAGRRARGGHEPNGVRDFLQGAIPRSATRVKLERWLATRGKVTRPPNVGQFVRLLNELSVDLSPGQTLELGRDPPRSEEHTSELQSLAYLVCRLLLEK